MYHSQFSRKLCIAAIVAGFLLVAGCSNQPANEAANQAPQQSSPPKAAPNKKPAAQQAQAKVVPASAKVSASAKVREPAQPLTIPKGTAITAIMGETLATDKTHQGDSFIATLSSPVQVDGKTVLPKGAHLKGRVVTVKKHELKVVLASITVHGKSYDLTTNSRRPSDKVKAENGNGSAATQDKSNEKNTDKQKKDNSTLSAKTQLTFKLAKPVTVPVKG